MNNDFGKYQELVNNWAKKNDIVFVLPEFLDLFKQIEKEGRVEGMKQELKDTLTTLKAIDSELDRRNVDMMLKTLIKIKEKRLKELKKGGKV